MKVRAVVPAYNEAASLPALLRSLQVAITYAGQRATWQLEVVVVANRCSDDTAAIARAHDAHVIETDTVGKVEALRAGMVDADVYVCVDADVVVGQRTVFDVVHTLLSSTTTLAVCPPLAVPPLRWPCTPLAWALHRYNAHRGFSRERLWLSGRFYALRTATLSVISVSPIFPTFPTVEEMEKRGGHGPLQADDVWLSRALLARGAAAIVHIDTDPVVFRPPSTMRGMSRTWRRLRRELSVVDTLFPELGSPGRDRRVELHSFLDHVALAIFNAALWMCRVHADHFTDDDDDDDAWLVVPESKAR
jgi:glycosyltransferase involved in cell wall biosynthesis